MVMISEDAIMRYREAFPESDCFYGEPSEYVIVTFGSDAPSHIQPEDETEKQFLERIERSKQAGKNLFEEEWPELVYEKDCLY